MDGKNSKKGMLGYSKVVLDKLSFDKRLFLKEYRKSLSWLNAEERQELRKWVRDRETRNPSAKNDSITANTRENKLALNFEKVGLKRD